MKKIVFALLFILPVSLFAQLDKLHQGMSLQEFHKNFPSAIPDLQAMTSSIYKQDTLLGIVGESQYTAVKDSVNQYLFQSINYSGPSSEYPKADSSEYLKLLRAAQELTGHYSDIFGTPAEKKSSSPRSSVDELGNQAVYMVSWKNPDGAVMIIVHRVIENENYINAPVNDTKDKKKKSANYAMEIRANGKWSKLRIDFEIGITKNQFRALMPMLASQVKDFPDCWMMNDTLAKRDTEWHFWFVENGLAGFSYDCYAGDNYGSTNKATYPILIKKAKQMQDEEEKSYGRPTTLQAPATDAYVPIKKIPNAFFYDDVYYNAEWEMDKGKKLFIRLHENGGKGETFLHLEVFLGDPKD
ncbi:MAG TPA: hypothetical protein VFJ43_11795 [Bacteroidia bacterium]|nr:hypothetical protein [Bacteroidia bacterium]